VKTDKHGLGAITALGLMAAFIIPCRPLAAQQPAGQDSARGQVPVVTLKDAIELALKVHPQMVSAQSNVDVAHAQQRQAVGTWLPTVNASSSVNRRLTSAQAGFNAGSTQQLPEPFGYSTSLNAQMTVFDFGRRAFQNRQMNANAAASEAALVNQQFQVTLLTKQAFFNALAAVELERVAAISVERAQEQLKISRDKLTVGTAVRSDTLQATVTLGQAQLQLLNAQSQRTGQEAVLARLIGFNGPVTPVPDSTNVAVGDVDTTSIRSEALQNSPAVAQAEAQARLSNAVVNMNRTTYLPTLNASFNNSYTSNGSSWVGGFAFDSAVRSSSLSLSLSWTLFNGFTRETNLSTALANREAAEASAADSRRLVNAQVTQFLAALEAARVSFTIATASRAAAEEALRVQRERYRLGAATIVDVLTAQQSLQQAEVDAVNARVNYQVAKAQLAALVGREL
jgi:outer membrane protein TolC